MTKVELAAITNAVRRCYDLPGADKLTIKAVVAELCEELGSINLKFNEDSFRFDCFGMILLRQYGQATAREKLAERAEAITADERQLLADAVSNSDMDGETRLRLLDKLQA